MMRQSICLLLALTFTLFASSGIESWMEPRAENLGVFCLSILLPASSKRIENNCNGCPVPCVARGGG